MEHMKGKCDWMQWLHYTIVEFDDSYQVMDKETWTSWTKWKSVSNGDIKMICTSLYTLIIKFYLQ